METISIVEYDAVWPELFEQEAQRIKSVLSQSCDIEHIGSTSVPDLDAKPVIDIMLGFEKLDAQHVIEQMESIGYKHWKEDTFQDVRVMFTKWNGDVTKRLINAHATTKGSDFWNEQLAFRDKLRSSKELAGEYADLKKNLANKHKSDPEAYTAAKTEFVRKALSA